MVRPNGARACMHVLSGTCSGPHRTSASHPRHAETPCTGTCGEKEGGPRRDAADIPTCHAEVLVLVDACRVTGGKPVAGAAARPHLPRQASVPFMMAPLTASSSSCLQGPGGFVQQQVRVGRRQRWRQVPSHPSAVRGTLSENAMIGSGTCHGAVPARPCRPRPSR